MGKNLNNKKTEKRDFMCYMTLSRIFHLRRAGWRKLELPEENHSAFPMENIAFLLVSHPSLDPTGQRPNVLESAKQRRPTEDKGILLFYQQKYAFTVQHCQSQR